MTRPVTPWRKDYGFEADALSDSDALLIAHWDGVAVGYVAVSRDWTGFAIIDDIAVDTHARGQGVGAALVEAACGWALGEGLPGIRLETQSTNPDACRLYARCGFRLGGHDAHLYDALHPGRGEVALFWYRQLP